MKPNYDQRANCASCAKLGGPCQRKGLLLRERPVLRPGRDNNPKSKSYSPDYWQNDAIHGFHSIHEITCGRPTYGSCTVGTWCNVTCGFCWDNKFPAQQLTLFGD